MPIEVRQLVIRSTVDSAQEPAPGDAPDPQALEQLRLDILSECKSMVEEQIQQLRER
jgi:hypothetical protein